MKNIQSNLLSAFESSGLTYDDLAKRTNLPKSALYRYINGDTEKIPIDRFQAICRELHVDAKTVLGWKDETPTPEPPPISTDEIRILIPGISKLSPEQLERAKNAFRAMFLATYPELNAGEEDK